MTAVRRIGTFHFSLSDEIDRCRPWIQAALDNSLRSHDFSDVRTLILTNQAQLWSVDTGCAVTTITYYPRSTVLSLWLCGGDFQDVYNEHYWRIENFAKENQCDQIVINGRRGWERRMKAEGYKASSVVITKEI